MKWRNAITNIFHSKTNKMKYTLLSVIFIEQMLCKTCYLLLGLGTWILVLRVEHQNFWIKFEIVKISNIRYHCFMPLTTATTCIFWTRHSLSYHFIGCLSFWHTTNPSKKSILLGGTLPTTAVGSQPFYAFRSVKVQKMCSYNRNRIRWLTSISAMKYHSI